MKTPNAGRTSQHTPETILRIIRLSESGIGQSEIGHREGLDRHRVADIIDGMFDHVIPAHKCPSCHRMVHGRCVACRAHGAERLTISDAGTELALNGEEAERFKAVRQGLTW